MRDPRRSLNGGSEGAQSPAVSARSHNPASDLDTIDLDSPVDDSQGGHTEVEEDAETVPSGSGCGPSDVIKDDGGDADDEAEEDDDDEDEEFVDCL